jgi:hypothetical protein
MKTIFTFFILISLLGCQKNIEPDEFVGTWIIDGIPYSKAKITFSKNHTFEYVEKNDFAHSNSKGQWEIRKDTLILNSVFPNECLYVSYFSQDCNDEQSAVFKLFIETTIENCQPKNIKKFFTKFDNTKFVKGSNSLVFIPTVSCSDFAFKFNIHR